MILIPFATAALLKSLNVNPLTSGITGAIALPLHGAWKGLRKQFAGRPDLALRSPREEISRSEGKALSQDEKTGILQRYEEMCKGTEEKDRKKRRGESERQLRHKLRDEAEFRADHEGGTAKKVKEAVTSGEKAHQDQGERQGQGGGDNDTVEQQPQGQGQRQRRGSASSAISTRSGSEVLWEDEGVSGPGGLNDEDRKEVEKGAKEIEAEVEHGEKQSDK
jgi:hypothetical protein